MKPEQFELPMRDSDRALLKSMRLRAVLRSYAKAVGVKAIADLWGCDEGTVVAKLEERNRNYVKTHEWLAVFAVDAEGTVFAAWCDQAGYERAERKQPPQSEEERLVVAYRELCGDEIHELARKKAGL